MKKKISAALAMVLLAALLLQACAKTDLTEGITLPQGTPTQEDASEVSTVPTAEQSTLPEREVVHVFDLGGLIRAIGDNREIVIAAGSYTLPDDGGMISATGMFEMEEFGEPLYGNENVTISEIEGDAGITIRGVSNLKIRAEDSAVSATPVTLISPSEYCNGLVFLECSDIEIENIAFTRVPGVGGATFDAMLLFRDCTDVRVSDCTFACEFLRTAIETQNVQRMTIERIYATETHVKQLLFADSSDITVRNSTFEWCYGEFEFENATGVEFNNVHFRHGNGEVMFVCWDEVSDVTLRGCVFDGPGFPLLTNSERVKFFDYGFGDSVAVFTQSGDFAIDDNGIYTGTRTQYISMDYALALVRRIVADDGVDVEISGSAIHDDEVVYEVHAFIDMPEHTATLGWYYVGRTTARVWETTYGDAIEVAPLDEMEVYETFWESMAWINDIGYEYENAEITGLVLYDLDGDGVSELWLSARLDGILFTGYFARRDNKPIELLHSFDETAHGGGQVIFRVDPTTDRLVVGTYSAMTGVWGDYEYYMFYELVDGWRLKRIASFDYDAYTSGYDDSLVESYTINGKPGTEREFNELVARFSDKG